MSRSCEIHRVNVKNVYGIWQRPNWSVIFSQYYLISVFQWHYSVVWRRIDFILFASYCAQCILLKCLVLRTWTVLSSPDMDINAFTEGQVCSMVLHNRRCLLYARTILYKMENSMSPVHICPASVQCTGGLVWTIRFFPKWISILLCAVLSLCLKVWLRRKGWKNLQRGRQSKHW